jgi:hypothetical protein
MFPGNVLFYVKWMWSHSGFISESNNFNNLARVEILKPARLLHSGGQVPDDTIGLIVWWLSGEAGK